MPEAASDFISGVAVTYANVDVRLKFADSWLNKGRIIRLVADWFRFTHLHAVFSCSLQPAVLTQGKIVTS